MQENIFAIISVARFSSVVSVLTFFFASCPKGSFILLKRQRKGLEKLALIKLYFSWPRATQFK